MGVIRRDSMLSVGGKYMVLIVETALPLFVDVTPSDFDNQRLL